MVTNNEKQEFSNRLNLILDKAGVPPKGKGRQGALADVFGVSQKGARKWLEGEAIPETKRITKFIEIYKKYGVTGEWLLYGNSDYAPDWVKGKKGEITSPPVGVEPNAEWLGHLEEWDGTTPLGDDEVELPFFKEVEISAGSGRFHIQENNGRKLRFSKLTLKKHGVAIDSAACIRVVGDSMEPVIRDGCTVGIDTGKQNIKDGDIYAIDHCGHLRIKRLYKLPAGIIRVNSYNPDYPDEFYNESDGLSRVIGRVFWYSVLL
ncbi:MAG: helix-turn-helix transcriptional regulator [Methylovulum sp.]|nr:helix-turn-helix transcriptional regulator [Methylovulum sp.]